VRRAIREALAEKARRLEDCKSPGCRVQQCEEDNENEIFEISRDFGSPLEACDEVTHAAGLARIDNRRKSAQR